MSNSETLERPPSPGRVSREELIQARAAQAMWQVAHDLELEWRSDRSQAANFAAVTLAGRMAHDMDCLKVAGSAPFVVADASALREVLARFSLAVRTLPAIAPEECRHCGGMGFVGVIADQGEVCPECRGARVVGEAC